MSESAGPRAEALRLMVDGCSAREAARRVGYSNVAVARWASLAGMVLKRKTDIGGLAQSWPPVRVYGLRLCLAARITIRARLEQGCSQRRIAAELGVAPSTVSREISRGSRGGVYDPGWSQQRADRARRRPRPLKLAVGTRLREVVAARLNLRHSPQQIARRLRLDFGPRHDLAVSHETIYQALYVQGRGALRTELHVDKALRSGRTGRRPRSALPPRTGRPWLAGAHYSQRPAEANDRAVPGHWEGDLVVGPFGRTALITLVERTSRFALIRRLPLDHTSPTVVDHLAAMINALPRTLIRSLTWDQGSEMAACHQFRIATNCPVYFCDPHSPWQRGSNENLNGLIRDFYPKGTDFAAVSDDDIANMQHLLNTRPRATLDWLTPAEKINSLIGVAMTT